MKIGLGYTGETSQTENSSATIGSYLNVEKPVSKASVLSKRIKAFYR